MNEIDSGFIELIRKGGIFIYPIFLCSIVALAIFLQKMWVLRRGKILPDNFLNLLYDYLSRKKYSDAANLSRMNGSSISRIASGALQKVGASKEVIRESIEESGRREATELGRYIEGLGAISNVSTLLGLLGTISGMIKIFRVISEKTIVDPPSLAGGISEALYTTAFGLLVAIPAFIAYKYLNGRADEFIADLEDEGKRILDEINSPPLQNQDQI
jgi:biopolymer transport protein ExbB